MESLPIIVIIVLLFFFFGRIKIPKGLKPVPALELEFASHYEATVFLNGEELIHLPPSPEMIESYRQEKGQLSASSKVLKYMKDGSGYELLLNLEGIVHRSVDSFTIDIEYIKHPNKRVIKNFGEIDYALAYVHEGKLLLDSDIQEHNIKFLDDQGKVSAEFKDLASKVRNRRDRLEK